MGWVDVLLQGKHSSLKSFAASNVFSRIIWWMFSSGDSLFRVIHNISSPTSIDICIVPNDFGFLGPENLPKFAVSPKWLAVNFKYDFSWLLSNYLPHKIIRRNPLPGYDLTPTQMTLDIQQFFFGSILEQLGLVKLFPAISKNN